MIAKLKANYAKFIATKAGAIVNRIVLSGVAAFGVTFVPQAIEVHLFTVPGFFNLALWHVVLAAALYAAGTAVLVGLQSVATTLFSKVHVPQMTAAGQAKFASRQAATNA